MIKINSTNKAKSFTQEYAGPLWIIAGTLFMLPSVFGEGRTELFPLGIMFLVFGIVVFDKKDASKDSKNPNQ